jgi:hypothetical protein
VAGQKSDSSSGNGGSDAGIGGGSGGKSTACADVVAVKASGEYQPAKYAFDCKFTTEWQSGDFTGWVSAQFAGPTTITGVVLTAEATPATDEIFTVSGSNDGVSWTQLATSTEFVAHGTQTTFAPITFPSVTVNYLRIDVNGENSWVGLIEAELYTGIGAPATGGAAGAQGGSVGAQGGAGGAAGNAGGSNGGPPPPWAAWPMPNSPEDVAAGAPNPPSYTDNGDGTVSDNVTGLMWQQSLSATTYAWADAVAYCPTLTLGGHTGWRLPSIIELISINDYGLSAPSLSTTTFPGTPENQYFWSSTPLYGDTTHAWYVESAVGNFSFLSQATAGIARCVRAATATPLASGHYVVSAGTVYDTATKLTWQQTASAATYAAADAQVYCAGLGATLGGTGWRLPTIKELATIIDFATTAPTIDLTAFPTTPQAQSYQSATQTAPSVPSGEFWNISFFSGAGSPDPFAYPARCVR